MSESHMAMMMHCTSCGHGWVACSPVPCAAESECPSCHAMKGQQLNELTESVMREISLLKGNTVLLGVVMELLAHFASAEGERGKERIQGGRYDEPRGPVDDALGALYQAEMVEEVGKTISGRPIFRLLWDNLEKRAERYLEVSP